MGKRAAYKAGLAFALCFFVTPLSSQAGLIIENHLYYFKDSWATGASTSAARSFGGLFAGATIPKIYILGWNTNFFSQTTESTAGNEKSTGYEMGPKGGLFIGKAQSFSLSLAIHPLVKATHTDAAGTELKLSGYGFQGELGFSPQIRKKLHAGVKIIYRYNKYTSSTDSGNTTSDVSFSQTSLMPVIYLSWRF